MVPIATAARTSHRNARRPRTSRGLRVEQADDYASLMTGFQSRSPRAASAAARAASFSSWMR